MIATAVGLLIAAAPAQAAVSFSRADFATADGPNSVAVGDFNGDSDTDLAVANALSNEVSILIGDGAGGFSAPTNFAAGEFPSPFQIAVGDLNGDSNQDLAVANGESNRASVLTGDGSGSFSAPATIILAPEGLRPASIAVGDFNGDSNQDLATANGRSDNVSILIGDGTGGFARTEFAAGLGSAFVAVGDFDNDSNQDLAVVKIRDRGVSILLGDGAGRFSAPTHFAAGDDPVSTAIGDFNNDSNQDLAVTNTLFSGVSILTGDGAGGFSAPTPFAAGTFPHSIAVGDFDGDSNQDLAVTNFEGVVSILIGDGAGGFSAPTNFAVGNGPETVAVGDFDSDSKQDLAVANGSDDDVSILLNTSPPIPAISIDDVRVVERDAGTIDAVFTVSLSNAFNEQVTADFATADGTAVASSDYVAAGGTVVFAPGEAATTIAVEVKGDTTAEPDETFSVDLSNPSAATIADPQGTGTILDDDPATKEECKDGGWRHFGFHNQGECIRFVNTGRSDRYSLP